MFHAYYVLLVCEQYFSQAIIASAFARKDHLKAKATASRVLQLGLILGLLLGLLLGVGLHTGSRLFTEDQGVLHHIYVAIPVQLQYAGS